MDNHSSCPEQRFDMAEYTKNEAKIEEITSTLNTLLKERGDYFNKTMPDFIKHLEDKDKQIASLNKEIETLKRQQQQQQQEQEEVINELKEKCSRLEKLVKLTERQKWIRLHEQVEERKNREFNRPIGVDD